MSSFTKQYTDEEMNAALGALLSEGESLETAVYCVFKATGFFASYRQMITGYIGITDKERIISCKYGVVQDSSAVYNMEDITGVKIQSVILGQSLVTIVFNSDKKQTLKFQVAPKVAGQKLPNQERNAEKLIEILENKKKMLE